MGGVISLYKPTTLAMCGVPVSHYKWQKSQVLDAKNCYVQVYKFVVSLQMQNRKTTDKISIVPNLPNYSIVVIAFAFCQLTTNFQNPVCCSCHCCDEQVCRACTQRHTGTLAWAHLGRGLALLLCKVQPSRQWKREGGGGGADYKRQQKKCIEVIAGVENHEARQLLQSAENSPPPLPF